MPKVLSLKLLLMCLINSRKNQVLKMSQRLPFAIKWLDLMLKVFALLRKVQLKGFQTL